MNDMINTVMIWFEKDTPENRDLFLKTPKDKLIQYHATLGRDIRNEFKLWETEWIPDIRRGVDCSPDHPDQISMKVIEEVWTLLQ